MSQSQPPSPSPVLEDELPELPLPPASISSNSSSQPPVEHSVEHPASASSVAAGPSSSRPSSAGSSSKRPAPEDDISELVRKAKASRYAQSVRKPDDDDLADMLERDLSCAICSEVLTNPVACFDCLHNFCGSCLAPWLERTNTCPTCRQIVKKIGDNHSTAHLIETILTRFPEKRRDPEELKELEKVYKPGQTVHIEEADPGDDDDDDENRSDEDEDPPHIEWPPCPCCAPNNRYGFQCPDPIPATDPPHRADVYIYRNHVTCPDCPNIIPTTWKPSWKCQSCNTVSCSALFTCDIPGTLRFPEAHIADFGIASQQMFRGNLVELRRFEDWLASTNTTEQQVWHRIYNWALGHYGGRIPIRRRMEPPDVYVCGGCARSALSELAMPWWIAEKPPLGDNRPRCWYGWNCRTQFHNPSHAEKLQHCCPETPEAERGRGGRGGRGSGARLDVAGVVGPVVDLAGEQQAPDGGLPEHQQ